MTARDPRAASVSVARLEVHGGAADALAARQRAEALLGGLELRPRALPPEAILCVRELRDPLPGALSLASRDRRPPRAWEQALQRDLDRLAAAAAWPSRGAVPPTAAAVAFADDAELLASLAQDLLRGAISGRWWWRLLLRGLAEPRRAVAAAWRGAVEHAPAALDRLAERGEAAPFVRALEEPDHRALAVAIAHRFALPLLASIAAPQAARPAPRAAASTPPATAAPDRPAAPWRGIAAEAETADSAALPPERRALLGIVLTLARAPALARSAAFAIEAAAWRAAPGAPPSLAQDPHPPPPSLPAPGGPPSPDAPVQHEPHERGVAPGAVDGAGAAPLAASAGEPPVAGAAAPAAADDARGAASAEGSPADMAPPPFEQPTAPGEADGAEPLPGAPPSARAARSPAPRARAFGKAIETKLGGLFYLANLALYLRLYGDDENLALSPWDLLELVGRRLLCGRGDDDPLWPVLAALAGRREGEPPGARFTPPLEWRMPPRWLVPFDPASVGWTVRGGRLLVAHGASFVLLDVPSKAALAEELAPYGDLVALPALAPPPPSPDDPLERWVWRLVPYLRARLGLALGLDDREDLATVLLCHRARVHATDTHVDVVLSLDALPVAIRLAGLDRDPGWIAAAGRFLAFHFE